MYRLERSFREERPRNQNKNPSFSSTLLDKIYRSIDEVSYEEEQALRRETVRRKQQNSAYSGLEEEDEMGSLRRACMIQKWMDRKVKEKVKGQRRYSLEEWDRKLQFDQDALFFSSTSSSSDSSSVGFSSSDNSSIYNLPRPKPIRTSISSTRSIRSEAPLYHDKRELYLFDDYQRQYRSFTQQTQSLSYDENFIKSKSRALKIYSNLKKVKQPISPGGRLASFLNSIFKSGNAKKSKVSSSFGGVNESAQGSTCSSTSSYTRSCLSKSSPSSRRKSNNGVKRTVRFYPVSVIFDEDCRPYGHKSLYDEEKVDSSFGKSASRSNDDLRKQFMEENFRVKEAARDLLQKYRNQKADSRAVHVPDNAFDDEDDSASYSSSDLFELDHLRYSEELPVYETTHLDTNRAIANGMIL